MLSRAYKPLMLYNYSVQICRTEMLWPHPHMAMFLWLSSCGYLPPARRFPLVACPLFFYKPLVIGNSERPLHAQFLPPLQVSTQYENVNSKSSMCFQPMYSGTPLIAATLGEQHFGRYTGVDFIEGLLDTNCSFGTWVPGCYVCLSKNVAMIVYMYTSWYHHTEVAFIQEWPLRGGSTIHA